jgi:tetratricopeptide (TPR) repeat protein
MNTAQAGFRTLSIFDEESVSIDSGRLQWVPVRRRLGVESFGINAYRAAEAGDVVVEDHVESPGQEELYVVLSGRAKLQIDGENVDAPAGTAVFVPEPDVRRSGVALEDGTVMLAVGGWRDRPYHSLPWEPLYLAQESMRQGDWAAAAETLESEAGDHRDTAILQFRLACCHARLGEHDVAIKELRRAIEISPQMRERASAEEHLSSIRGLEGSPIE